MNDPTSHLLGDLLRAVSRSFFLTLRLLPPQVRPQIAIAYLLARATDTVADTAVLPVEERLQALDRLRDRIVAGEGPPLDFSGLAENQALPAERELLTRIEEVIRLLSELPSFDRCCVREVISTITSGQELDLRRFGEAAPGRIVALGGDDDLDDYIFRVAGCVGGFWTRLCRTHLFPTAPLDMGVYREDGLRFGKGLQLVNILRDLPVDLRQGRCYLPEAELAEAGMVATDLLEPSVEPRLRRVFRRHLEVAAGHLSAGWRYTCVTPRQQMRVRLACALPLLIGAETLRLLARNNVLDPTRRIKVSRRQVKGYLIKASLLHPFPRCWERLFDARLPEMRMERAG